MAFNGSGVFVRLYNWVVDRDEGTKIQASRMDAEMDGMATGLSTCITKDGQTVTTQKIPLAVGASLGDGSVGTPILNFTADTDSGFYRIGANNIGIGVNGAKVLDISATGLGVVGTVLNGNGTVLLPAFSFTSDPDSGWYRIGANNLGVAVNGAKVLDIATTGLGVTGTFSVNGDTFLRHPLTTSPTNDAGTNIGLGKGALISVAAPSGDAQYMTAVGYNAGSSATTADHWTAVGAWALSAITTGYKGCTAIGIDSQRALTTGTGNTTVGEHTMIEATDATNNVAVGLGACYFTNGTENVGVGVNALCSVTGATRLTGTSNVAVGAYACERILTTSDGNVAVGYQALHAMTTANNNVAVGKRAGQTITTGQYNLCLGSNAGTATLTTGNDNILIGTQNHAADTPAASTSDYLNIGGLITGTMGGSPTITPPSNDGVALGTASKSFSDLFLASGGVINWNNGDVTLTHSSGLLSTSGAFSVSGQLVAASPAGAVVNIANFVTPSMSNGQITYIGIGSVIGANTAFTIGYNHDSTAASRFLALSPYENFGAFKLYADGGMTSGAPTGGNKGAGTFNLAADVYKNNTAYTNPDFVFEHFYRDGRIEKFAGNEGAEDYAGLMPLSALRQFTKENLRLPRISDDPAGMFERGDKALEKIEELALYILELHERIVALEAR